jgi:hypothetical protein
MRPPYVNVLTGHGFGLGLRMKHRCKLARSFGTAFKSEISPRLSVLPIVDVFHLFQGVRKLHYSLFPGGVLRSGLILRAHCVELALAVPGHRFNGVIQGADPGGLHFSRLYKEEVGSVGCMNEIDVLRMTEEKTKELAVYIRTQASSSTLKPSKTSLRKSKPSQGAN